jgi:hypothetical protein
MEFAMGDWIKDRGNNKGDRGGMTMKKQKIRSFFPICGNAIFRFGIGDGGTGLPFWVRFWQPKRNKNSIKSRKQRLASNMSPHKYIDLFPPSTLKSKHL